MAAEPGVDSVDGRVGEGPGVHVQDGGVGVQGQGVHGVQDGGAGVQGPGRNLALGAPWEDRLELARAGGRWVQQVLEQGYSRTLVTHGPSPRERQPLRSQIWVCFADSTGAALRPPVASSRLAVLRSACLDGDHSGSSVWIGWPSKREAVACVEAAGLRWPDVVLRSPGKKRNR